MQQNDLQNVFHDFWLIYRFGDHGYARRSGKITYQNWQIFCNSEKVEQLEILQKLLEKMKNVKT
jgi:putative lipoic acid-binding regulatory protein